MSVVDFFLVRGGLVGCLIYRYIEIDKVLMRRCGNVLGRAL